MDKHTHTDSVPYRFADVLSSDQATPRRAWDRVLLDLDDYVVAPTLGSILPLWLLVIPRLPTLNFAVLERRKGKGSVARLISEILAHLRLPPSSALWFEHGPSAPASPIGCGVDQAHLHILLDAPFTLDKLALEASTAANISWTAATSNDVYDSLMPGDSYLVLGSASSAFCTTQVERIGSQFLRRQVATIVGKPHEWNYKTHPHAANVWQTISVLGPLSRHE